MVDRMKGCADWDRCSTWLKSGAKTMYEWWTYERVHKLVENGVPNKDLDLVVFDMLSHYVCASLVEDQYGVVQRDIPKTLETMVRFRSEVDKWRAEISPATNHAALNPSQSDSTTTATTTESPPQPNAKSKQAQQLDEERAKADAILLELSDGLKESIGRIVRTFGNKLMAFKLPPAVASGLQGFMDCIDFGSVYD